MAKTKWLICGSDPSMSQFAWYGADWYVEFTFYGTEKELQKKIEQLKNDGYKIDKAVKGE